eukprot:c2799_g1_i1 orf=161-322(+)
MVTGQDINGWNRLVTLHQLRRSHDIHNQINTYRSPWLRHTVLGQKLHLGKKLL